MKPINHELDQDAPRVQPLPECPDCGSADARHEYKQQSFRYGRGDGAVELECEVPVYTCQQCGCEWTGSEADEARQVAVCRHLGRLTPEEVRGIRERYRLSQAEFGRITGFGEASLSRWETGAQVQSASNDSLLRLIQAVPLNLTYLQQISNGASVPAKRKFRMIEITPELRRREEKFKLQRAS